MSSNEFHTSETSTRTMDDVRWRDDGALLIIQMENRHEILLRMDNEVYCVKVSLSIRERSSEQIKSTQYETIGRPANGGRIFLRLLYTQPLPWAEGTTFDAYYDDLNQLALKLDVSHKKYQEDYDHLIVWMKSYIPNDCEPISTEDADKMWKNM